MQGSQLHLDGPAMSMPRLVHGGVHGQTVEPRAESVRGAQPGQVPPGSDHRILDRVARELRVPEDEPGGRVQPRERRIDERDEGVMITPLRPFDECSLVHSHPFGGTTRVVALIGVGAVDQPKVPTVGLSRAGARATRWPDREGQRRHGPTVLPSSATLIPWRSPRADAGTSRRPATPVASSPQAGAARRRRVTAPGGSSWRARSDGGHARRRRGPVHR